MLYPEYGLMIVGILMMCSAFFVTTRTVLATVIFNIFPFFSGVYVCLVGLAIGGWIVVGQ